MAQAWTGQVRDHHRVGLPTHRAHRDVLAEAITGLSAESAHRLQAAAAALARLATIPGVARQTAAGLVAASGTQLGRFPAAGHRASWAGLGPGRHERAGQRPGGTPRTGSKGGRRAVGGAAPAAARTKPAGRPGLARRQRRRVVRRGKATAAVAVGHQRVIVAYPVLRDRLVYQAPAPDALAATRRERAQARAVAQLRHVGFAVTLTPKHPAA